MTVYVDNAGIPATAGGFKSRWSHTTATTREELIAFAEGLGLKREWFQTCKNVKMCPPDTCPHWHFDVTAPKRRAAIAAGAVAIDIREFGALCTARREARRDAERAVAAGLEAAIGEVRR